MLSAEQFFMPQGGTPSHEKMCYAPGRRCGSEVEVSVVLRSRGTVWTLTPAVNPLLLPKSARSRILDAINQGDGR